MAKRFCNAGCRESYREDRKAGLIYGAMMVMDKLFGWDKGSFLAGVCAYCGTQIVGQREITRRQNAEKEKGS